MKDAISFFTLLNNLMWQLCKGKMKKILFLILIGLLTNDLKAQFFPFQQVDEIPYYSTSDFHDKVMIQDSSIYESRQCLQIKNIFSGKTEYRWTNYYQLNMILPDKHGNYVYLKNNSYIGVYDSLLNDHININTGPLLNNYIESIGISPNGNIWAGTSQKLGIYNGSSWQVYPINGYYYNRIKVINDTSAYLSGYPFLRFHNGIVDTLFTLPLGYYLRDWDVDSLGNLWIAGGNKLFNYKNSTVSFFDSTNSPVGLEKFNKVVVGKNGHIWTCGAAGKMFEYNGASWATHLLPSPYLNIDNFNLDSLSRPWVIAGNYSTYPSPQYTYMSIYKWNGSNFNSPVSFPFMPYNNIQAIAPNALANGDGVFSFNFNYQSFRILGFRGSPERPEATDVNCFRTYSEYTQYGEYPFGTNNGIYSLWGTVAGLDSSVLPSDTVNCLLSDHGSDYVCTDNGLLIYNGVFYNTLDTTNSPLPSNKITFATVVSGQTYNKLYIGTDNGLAIYSNNQWSVYDSTYFGLSNCYVTGILPPQYFSFYDTTTYVSTMGSGLIKLFNSGGYEILNTANGKFNDDSLYYVIRASLAKCGEYVVIGTKENGIAVYDNWSNDLQYYSIRNGYPFTQSQAAVDVTNSAGYVLIGTNTGLYWASICSGIDENNISDNLNVYPNPSTGVFTIEQPSGSYVEIRNILGELIYKSITRDEKTSIDLNKQSKGIYFITTTDRNHKTANRKIIVH